jgi:hypothetical protein
VAKKGRSGAKVLPIIENLPLLGVRFLSRGGPILRRKLKGITVPVGSLNEDQIKVMYSLFERYYENVNFEQFKSDLYNKTKVILLITSKKEIGGFSTLTEFKIQHDGKSHHVLYSGDTIIDKNFRGTAALTMEFLKNILMAKVKRPFSPVWWFLISKGYKTYLLLANNFITYYPRFDRETPSKEKSILDRMAQTLFKSHYSSQSGLIEFPKEEHERLKTLVAPISETLKEKNPKIAFFEERNPNWQDGVELACIGEVSLMLGIRHPLKIFLKLFKKRRSPSELVPSNH